MSGLEPVPRLGSLSTGAGADTLRPIATSAPQQAFAAPPEVSLSEPVVIAGRRLLPSAVFDTYWRFAARRQDLYLARLRDEPAPWTTDPILRGFRFTNVFRVADRVSQYLLSRVIYRDGAVDPDEDVIFRILLFKLFNKISTWEHLESSLGELHWKGFDYDHYAAALDRAAERGPIYSAAYVMPPPKLGEKKKHRNHLRLLELMMRDGLGAAVGEARSLDEIYRMLASYPSMGPFLAYQFTVDLNYSPVLDCSENDFVVAGPGARDGIHKCFGADARGIEGDVIRYMVEHQQEHFDRLGLDFDGLFGRPLHWIDAQNLFCEVDKYSRVAHPMIEGLSGRTRIKQRFSPLPGLPDPVFPPKWNLHRDRARDRVAAAA